MQHDACLLLRLLVVHSRVFNQQPKQKRGAKLRVVIVSMQEHGAYLVLEAGYIPHSLPKYLSSASLGCVRAGSVRVP